MEKSVATRRLSRSRSSCYGIRSRAAYTTEEKYKMKRVSYGVLCGLFLLCLTSICQPVRAQDPAKPQMSADVAAVLSKFVSTINSGDTTTTSTLISTKPNVTAIVNDRIYQGAVEIANAMSKLGAQQ